MERVIQAILRSAVALPLLVAFASIALAALLLLGPVLFVRRREPFERLVVILALVLGRRAGRRST